MKKHIDEVINGKKILLEVTKDSLGIRVKIVAYTQKPTSEEVLSLLERVKNNEDKIKSDAH